MGSESIQRGEALCTEGRFEEALVLFEQARLADPQERYQPAVDAFSRAIELEPRLKEWLEKTAMDFVAMFKKDPPP